MLELELLEARLMPTAVTINPNQDNTIYQESGSVSNGLGPSFFAGATNTGSIRRALVEFNVAGSVPAGATINSVSLTLNNETQKSSSAPSTVELHRVLAAWGEGTSNAGAQGGKGAPATTNDATWTFRLFNTQSWTTPGGDFSGTVSASASVGGPGAYTWSSTSQLVSDVQGWLSNPSSNFGWEVTGTESTPGSAKIFDSKDNSTAGPPPASALMMISS